MWLGIGILRYDDPLVISKGYGVAYVCGLISSWPSDQKEYVSRRMADYSRGTWRPSKVGIRAPDGGPVFRKYAERAFDQHGFKELLRA